MPAKVITFASAKGGSGKTTLTATFSSLLAELGYKILLIDCDEATHGLTLMYLDEVNNFPALTQEDRINCVGVFDNFDDDHQSIDVIKIKPGISFCPATYQFSAREALSRAAFHRRLRILLDNVVDGFDFIILDAQAGADPISLVTIDKSISDLVIIVSEYDPLSAAGVERLKAIAGDSLSFERTWVLLNKLLPDFVESFSEFLSVTHYLPPIPWTADVVRSYAKRELALNLSNGNEFTLAVLQTLKSIPISGLKAKVESWTEKKASALRQPIETQYDDLENLLEAATRQVSIIKTSRSRRFYYGILFALFVALIALTVGFFAFDFRLPLEKFSTYAGLTAVALTMSVMLATEKALSSSKLVRSFLPFLLNEDRSDTEIRRLERQIQTYSEKLQELEFLKAADSASLVDKTFSGIRPRLR